MPTDEEKLLAILNQPEVEVVETEDGAHDLNEEQRKTLGALLSSAMLTPEEIILKAQNDAVAKLREEDLARRGARRAKKKTKHRRR